MSDPSTPAPASEPTPNSEPTLGWAPKDEPSFWTRVRKALAGEPGPAATGESAPDAPMLPPVSVSTPKPRKARRTAFDKARAANAAKKAPQVESRRTRLRRASEEKREEKRDGNALMVESSRDESFGTPWAAQFEKTSRGFVELSGVLGGLGRQLASQDEHARVMDAKLSETLSQIPEAERAQAEALAGIARALGDQTGTNDKVAHSLEGVPEIVSLVKQGSGTVQGQLQTLGDMHRELVLQREQRERVVGGVQRVERALLAVGEQLQGFAARQVTVHDELRARTEDSVGRIERSLNAVAARFDLAAREQEDRSRLDRAATADQAERLERALAVMAARVHEQSVAIVGSQEDAAATFRRSQQAVVEGFEEAQERTTDTLERLHEARVKELARTRRRTNLMAAVCGTACLAVLGLFGTTFVGAERDRASAELSAERARTEAACSVARSRSEALFLVETAIPTSGTTAALASGVSVATAPVAAVGSGARSGTLPAGFGR